MRTEHRVCDEQDGDHWHDRTRGATRRFQHQHDKNTAEDHVPAVRDRGAIEEIVSARKGVNNNGNAGKRRDHIEPLHVVAKARGEREQQEAQ